MKNKSAIKFEIYNLDTERVISKGKFEALQNIFPYELENKYEVYSIRQVGETIAINVVKRASR